MSRCFSNTVAQLYGAYNGMLSYMPAVKDVPHRLRDSSGIVFTISKASNEALQNKDLQQRRAIATFRCYCKGFERSLSRTIAEKRTERLYF
jgi:hypothetical protein